MKKCEWEILFIFWKGGIEVTAKIFSSAVSCSFLNALSETELDNTANAD